MKAVRFHAAGDVRTEEVPSPQARDGEVLVAVEWCGICGSDLNEYLGGPVAIPSQKTGPHHLTGEVLPVTMGHEFSGRIVHAPASSSLSPGQSVVIDPRLYCSSCTACSQSATNCCDKIGFCGLSGGGGGLSEMVALPPTMLHILPDGTDLAAATLIEPLAVAWHAVKQCAFVDLKATPILIIGGGPIGVATIFVLKVWGAKMVFVSEKSRGRKEFLLDLVDAAFDPTEVNVPSKCKELTDGDGVGIVFDCAGSQPGFQDGCDSLKFHGIYANLAVPKGPMRLPFERFIPKELTLKSFLAYDEIDFAETVAAFVEGKFKGVERMITRRVTLDDVVDKGLKELVENPDEHIKILACARTESLL
ncbi:chaperonin 10-like protein [Penicillium frequentans]|nr:chaperonin 10-like protein [Penicillium glabrum]